ncbi:MAG: hypothetical protein AB7U95_29275 [Reyranella sp.]
MTAVTLDVPSVRPVDGADNVTVRNSSSSNNRSPCTSIATLTDVTPGASTAMSEGYTPSAKSAADANPIPLPRTAQCTLRVEGAASSTATTNVKRVVPDGPSRLAAASAAMLTVGISGSSGISH